MKQIISFTTTWKVVNTTYQVKYPFYRTLMKKMEEDKNKWKDIS
jgi:hypothetical protein